MKYETAKSLLLSSLIILSVVLTFSLWSYQPDYTTSQNTDPEFVAEADAGGEIATKRGVIIPSKAIFHVNNDYFGYGDPNQLLHLYNDLQHWSLTEYVEREDQAIDFHENKYIEMTYPETFPIDMVKSLFTLVDEVVLPNWNFDRILISKEDEQKVVSIYFPSVDGRHHIQFTVYDQQSYERVKSLLDQQEDLVAYMKYDEAAKRIYLPVERTELSHQAVTIETIEPSRFVNALFRNPSIVVTPNFGESYFIDGQRDMRVAAKGNRLEFINPIEGTTDRMGLDEIIEASLTDINDHKGWTADFHIMSIDKSINRIVYQMHYEGYPVYHEDSITLIEQQWRNYQLYKYNRPLFSLLSPFSGGLEELRSGKEVIYFLENIDQYDVNRVSDVQIGYYVPEIDRLAHSITLEPAWFMLYNDTWQRIRFDQMELLLEGGV